MKRFRLPEETIEERLCEWASGEIINCDLATLETDGTSCARCRRSYLKAARRRPEKKTMRIRFFPESHGYLCFKCCMTAPKCINCDTLSIDRETGLCRECFLKGGKDEN